MLLRVAGMAFAKAVFEVYVEDAVKQSLANVQEFVRVFLCTLVSRSNYAMEIAHLALLQVWSQTAPLCMLSVHVVFRTILMLHNFQQ